MYPTKDLLARTVLLVYSLKTPLLKDHKYVMIDKYRIVIERTGATLACNMDVNEAQETHHFLELDHPQEVLVIERYSVSSVRGLGRDPDLH